MYANLSAIFLALTSAQKLFSQYGEHVLLVETVKLSKSGINTQDGKPGSCQ